MSKTAHFQTDDKTLPEDLDTTAPEGPVQDDSYVTSQGKNEPVPVVGDDDAVEDPVNAATADSDKQLDRDDKEAINKSNIMKERTRGAEPTGQYREPDDSEMGLTQ